MGKTFLVQNCASALPCKAKQETRSCFPVVAATFLQLSQHEFMILQLGRYLEFLGFISNQSWAQSLVSKMSKITLFGEQQNTWKSIPRKAHADRAPCLGCSPSLAHLACRAERLDSPTTPLRGAKSCSWCPQATFALQSKGELSCVLPRSLCPHIPVGRELLCPSVAPPELQRLAVTVACLVFSSFILCPRLHF